MSTEQHHWSFWLQVFLAIILQLAIFVLTCALAISGLWLSAFTGALVFVLTFVPAILERQLSIYLPIEFSLITTAFLYASFALGEVRDFYALFWWWDLMLHSLSALTIGLIGFLAIYVFYMTNRIQIAPIYVAAMTLCLAATTGTIWEIFEFSMDWFFNFNMQKSGLIDTMTDLIVNFIGGLIASYLGYLYVRDGDSLIVDRLISKFVKKNPKIFKHRL